MRASATTIARHFQFVPADLARRDYFRVTQRHARPVTRLRVRGRRRQPRRLPRRHTLAEISSRLAGNSKPHTTAVRYPDAYEKPRLHRRPRRLDQLSASSLPPPPPTCPSPQASCAQPTPSTIATTAPGNCATLEAAPAPRRNHAHARNLRDRSRRLRDRPPDPPASAATPGLATNVVLLNSAIAPSTWPTRMAVGVSSTKCDGALAAIRTMPRAFSMSWPASCTMRSRANRSGLSTMIRLRRAVRKLRSRVAQFVATFALHPSKAAIRRSSCRLVKSELEQLSPHAYRLGLVDSVAAPERSSRCSHRRRGELMSARVYFAVSASGLSRGAVPGQQDRRGPAAAADRRRLLDAIAAIAGAGRPADLPRRPRRSLLHPRAFRHRPSVADQAVMFCDLVGSTSLAAKLDAEDWRDLCWVIPSTKPRRLRGLGAIWIVSTAMG